MYFKKYRPGVTGKQPHPSRMAVGQIVVRKGITVGYKYALRSQLNKAVSKGMEFSVHDDEKKAVFAIRRDK